MKKKILKWLLAAVALYVAAGIFVGNYFVNYALKRSEDGSPPPATKKIADPNYKAGEMPKARHEEVYIKSEDGLKLHSYVFYAEEPTDKWAILVHGYGRDASFAWDYADYYLKAGFNVLTPDLRGAGKSEGEYLTMGVLEARDIVLWASKIAEEHPESKILLHGVSMGAATSMLAAAEEMPHMDFLVEDCGYTSAYDMFGAQLEKLFHLPREPIMPWVNILSKVKTGVFLTDAAPIRQIHHVLIPTLFIHGDADALVPFRMMEELYHKSGAKIKAQYVAHGAGHADAKPQNPDAYFKEIFAFVK